MDRQDLEPDELRVQVSVGDLMEEIARSDLRPVKGNGHHVEPGALHVTIAHPVRVVHTALNIHQGIRIQGFVDMNHHFTHGSILLK